MRVDFLIRRWIARNPDRFINLRKDLNSIRAGVTVEQYVRQAFFIGLMAGLIAAVISFFLASFLFTTNLGLKPELYNVLNLDLSVENPGLPIMIAVQSIVGIAAFFIGAFIGYKATLAFPSLEKMTRTTKINIGLHNSVAYMYAMRRGGAELLMILRSISEMAAIYGEVSYEFRQVVRDADFFGYDVVNALKHLSNTTPSQKMRDFLQDMLSTVESGGDLAKFLQDRVRILQEEAKFEQKEFLQFLGLVGEIYVTIFIAGPLFLIVIMVVMGMMGSSSIFELSLIGYVVLPIGSLIFILMIDTISIKDENAVKYVKAKWLNQYTDVRVREQTGEEHLFATITRFDQLRSLKKWLAHPMKAFVEKPEMSCYFSAPVAIIVFIWTLINAPWGGTIDEILTSVDDRIMFALLIVMIPYAVLFTLWNNKIRGMESLIPDFLDRMAGINEVGLTLTQSITIMARANLGILAYEIRHIQRDILWGANFSDALIRFELRVRTALIARTVTLITKASTMNSSISDVLRIAAADARMSELLKRDRLSEMFIYTAIVYLSFFVFIFVIGVISTQFLEVLANQSKEGLSMAGPLANVGTMSLTTLERILYHTCLVQGLFSGLIAGMMGESSLKAGVKHSCILIIAALLAFNFAF
ncbi:MAG: type II secretion system F family protein [Methanobacteriota archaeon]